MAHLRDRSWSTPPHRPGRDSPAFVGRRRRAGAAYLLVLSAGMLLSVIGFGILSSSRSATRSAGQAADLDEAAALAEAGVEWGMAAVAANTNWRTTYASGVEAAAKAVGRGTLTFKLVDEVDGNLSNNASDAVRLYGVGRVGSATRLYSVQLAGTGAVLDVLKAAVHSAGNLSVSDNQTPTGGPLSCNGTLTVASGKTVTGDAEAKAFAGSGTVTGTKTTLSADKAMPAATAFDSYKLLATTIPFPSGGTVTKKVLSPNVNTVGAAAGLNANGVYYIRVPSTGTLTISASRLVSTLVVELDPGGKFATSGAFAWDPPRPDYPTLIVKGGTGSTVTLAGSSGLLYEAANSTNFNPAGMAYPYATGTPDTDTTDSYPAEFHGLVHVIGSAVATTVNNYFSLKGSLVTEGATSVGLGVKLVADPALASSPPAGYTASGQMTPAAGSWRWDKVP